MRARVCKEFAAQPSPPFLMQVINSHLGVSHRRVINTRADKEADGADAGSSSYTPPAVCRLRARTSVCLRDSDASVQRDALNTRRHVQLRLTRQAAERKLSSQRTDQLRTLPSDPSRSAPPCLRQAHAQHGVIHEPSISHSTSHSLCFLFLRKLLTLCTSRSLSPIYLHTLLPLPPPLSPFTVTADVSAPRLHSLSL